MGIRIGLRNIIIIIKEKSQQSFPQHFLLTTAYKVLSRVPWSYIVFIFHVFAKYWMFMFPHARMYM